MGAGLLCVGDHHDDMVGGCDCGSSGVCDCGDDRAVVLLQGGLEAPPEYKELFEVGGLFASLYFLFVQCIL